jgi:beta-lactamase class A
VSRITDRTELDRLIEKIRASFSGELAFCAKNLSTGDEIALNADSVLPTASTIKLAILAELYRQSRHDGVDLSERLTMQQTDIVGGSGVLKEVKPGLQPSLYDLAMLMVIVSDNTATNMLIDRVGGVNRVNQTMRDYELNSIVLHNRVDFDVIGDDVRRFAEATARDFMRFNELLLNGELVDAEASQAMIDIMKQQQYLDQVPRYFNYRPGARELKPDQQIWLGCKTGFFGGTRVDAGVILLPSDVQIAYCAMAHDSDDRSIVAESEPAVTNGLLGRVMLEYWWPGEWNASEAVVDSLYYDALLSDA